MTRRALISLAGAALLLLVSTPAFAGGWAVVHLDEPPTDVRSGTTWRVGFTVLQHDVTPTSEVDVVVTAVHQETGETVTANATQEGPVGHFVAEMTLPLAGGWKWAIEPAPFAATTFETLHVNDPLTVPASRVARLLAGTCASGEVIAAKTPLTTPVPAGDWLIDQPVSGGLTNAKLTLNGTLQELTASDHALSVEANTKDAAMLACGNLVATSGEEIVVGLQPVGDSRTAGVAVLRGVGSRTEVSLYLLTVDPISVAPTYAATARIEIVGGEASGAHFSPPSLTVAPGTRVTWTNRAASPHMVSGDDLAFADSGWLAPGNSFSLTFTEPATFRYRCGPHPWMTGTVVIA
jgi:plastocyanin